MNVVRLLAVNRYAVYAGGLAAILTPPVLARAGVIVPEQLRVAIVAGSLAVMTVTYLGERRLRNEEDGAVTAAGDAPDPSLGTQLAVAGALAGIAVGGYLVLRGRLWIGALFVVGAALFGRNAVARSVGGVRG